MFKLKYKKLDVTNVPNDIIYKGLQALKLPPGIILEVVCKPDRVHKHLSVPVKEGEEKSIVITIDKENHPFMGLLPCYGTQWGPHIELYSFKTRMFDHISNYTNKII